LQVTGIPCSCTWESPSESVGNAAKEREHTETEPSRALRLELLCSHGEVRDLRAGARTPLGTEFPKSKIQF